MHIVTNNPTDVTQPLFSLLLRPPARLNWETVRTDSEANDVCCERVHTFDKWRGFEIWIVCEVRGELRFPFGDVIADPILNYTEMMLVDFIVVLISVLKLNAVLQVGRRIIL